MKLARWQEVVRFHIDPVSGRNLLYKSNDLYFGVSDFLISSCVSLGAAEPSVRPRRARQHPAF